MIRGVSPQLVSNSGIRRSQQAATDALSAPKRVMAGGKVVKITGTKIGVVSNGRSGSNGRGISISNDRVSTLIPPGPITRRAFTSPSVSTPTVQASLSADIADTVNYFQIVTNQNRAKVRQLKEEVSTMQQQLRSPVREQRRGLLSGSSHSDKDAALPPRPASSSPFDYGFGFDATAVSAKPFRTNDYNSDFQYSSSSAFEESGYDFDSVYHNYLSPNGSWNPFDEDLVDESELHSGSPLFAERGARVPLDDSVASANPFESRAMSAGEAGPPPVPGLLGRMAWVDEEQQTTLARPVAEEMVRSAQQVADEQALLVSMKERAEQALRDGEVRLALEEEQHRTALEQEQERRRLAQLAEQLESERLRLEKERARSHLEAMERENRARLGQLEAAERDRQEQERRRCAEAEAERGRQAVARALAEEQERGELLAKVLAEEEEEERLRKKELANREEEEHAHALTKEAEHVRCCLEAEKAKLQRLEEEWLRKRALCDEEDLRRATRAAASRQQPRVHEPPPAKPSPVMCDSSVQCDLQPQSPSPPSPGRRHRVKKRVSFSSRDDWARAPSGSDSDLSDLCEQTLASYFGGPEDGGAEDARNDSGHVYFESFGSDSDSCSDLDLPLGGRRHIQLEKDFDSPQRVASPSDIIIFSDENDAEVVDEVVFSSDEGEDLGANDAGTSPMVSLSSGPALIQKRDSDAIDFSQEDS